MGYSSRNPKFEETAHPSLLSATITIGLVDRYVRHRLVRLLLDGHVARCVLGEYGTNS